MNDDVAGKGLIVSEEASIKFFFFTFNKTDKVARLLNLLENSNGMWNALLIIERASTDASQDEMLGDILEDFWDVEIASRRALKIQVIDCFDREANGRDRA